jgi:prepilin-type N-terminal cleavage/methylation domain-containing protein
MVADRMKTRGFTLFEVLMTLSILAVVLSLLYMTFHQSLAATSQTEEQADVIRRGRLILERMTGELKGSFLPAQQNPLNPFRYGLVGQTRKEGDDFLDRLDFTTMAGPQASPSEAGGEILEVGYFLDHEPGGKGLTLFRRQDEAIDGDLMGGGRTLAVCDRVRSLSFVFFDLQGGRAKEWNSLEGAHRSELPGRVEIRLKLEDARSKVHVFRTQVCLPR